MSIIFNKTDPLKTQDATCKVKLKLTLYMAMETTFTKGKHIFTILLFFISPWIWAKQIRIKFTKGYIVPIIMVENVLVILDKKISKCIYTSSLLSSLVKDKIQQINKLEFSSPKVALCKFG